MPTNYSGRFTVIALFILIALAGIFWPAITSPQTAFDPNVPFTKKTNLRPGIDMVGGTSLLYEIKPTDPLTFTAVALLLLVVAAFASWLPARRAGKVDPAIALRAD